MEIPVLTAYCGVDCSRCTDYKNGKCPGCRFPCKMMREFYEESDSHRDAYRRLEEYRKGRKGSENESGIQG